MNPVDFGAYLKQLRGNRSLREIERLSGLSHNCINNLEKSRSPRNGKAITPEPSSLRSLSIVYRVSYVDLLMLSGILQESEVRGWMRMNSELT